MLKSFFFILFSKSCTFWSRLPRYEKESVWWALKDCNNAFLIFDDLGRKSGKILETYDFGSKFQKLNIFFKSQKSMSRYKKSKIVIMRWKPMPWRYFQYVIMISFKNCVEKIFSQAFFLNLWKVKEFIKRFWTPKYDFFQKIKLDV